MCITIPSYQVPKHPATQIAADCPSVRIKNPISSRIALPLCETTLPYDFQFHICNPSRPQPFLSSISSELRQYCKVRPHAVARLNHHDALASDAVLDAARSETHTRLSAGSVAVRESAKQWPRSWMYRCATQAGCVRDGRRCVMLQPPQRHVAYKMQPEFSCATLVNSTTHRAIPAHPLLHPLKPSRMSCWRRVVWSAPHHPCPWLVSTPSVTDGAANTRNTTRMSNSTWSNMRASRTRVYKDCTRMSRLTVPPTAVALIDSTHGIKAFPIVTFFSSLRRDFSYKNARWGLRYRWLRLCSGPWELHWLRRLWRGRRLLHHYFDDMVWDRV